MCSIKIKQLKEKNIIYFILWTETTYFSIPNKNYLMNYNSVIRDIVIRIRDWLILSTHPLWYTTLHKSMEERSIIIILIYLLERGRKYLQKLHHPMKQIHKQPHAHLNLFICVKMEPSLRSLKMSIVTSSKKGKSHKTNLVSLRKRTYVEIVLLIN